MLGRSSKEEPSYFIVNEKNYVAWNSSSECHLIQKHLATKLLTPEFSLKPWNLTSFM